jgi:puromycin-sensitive aminopeptidase
VSENPHRLPRTVVPSRYDLRLEPDLANATFDGTVAITVDVKEATDTIVLNAIELEVTSADISVQGGERQPVSILLDADTERCTLSGQSFPVGPAVVYFTFSGILNDKLRGFYRSTFIDAEGVSQTIAVTQMQATDCRRGFPCWDEPDFKAVFAVTLVIPEHLVAISSSPEASRNSVGSGKTAVTFKDTMIMSSYLIAFVVGPLEMTDPVDVDGVPMRVVHVPGKGHLTSFGLEIGSFALRWFQNYYGIPYPGEKIDLVALPDFAAGAMENLGCITFRENLLLVDPATSTHAEEQTVADVVAHELAHMWFGDLVTMRWWNGIWLNEAFATFMEVAACDAFRKDWERWTSFSLERTAAFEVDSLASTRPVEFEVISPNDADGMFDVLTYQKGGALLRMLEQYLGEETFRTGISHYLKTHAYGNTETGDLWDAIEHTSGEPVRRLMDSWIWQEGYPVLDTTVDGNDLVLQQRRFRFDTADDTTVWVVPVLVREMTPTGPVDTKVLMTEATARVELTDKASAVVVNAGSHSFLRVAYSSELLSRLTGERLQTLSTAERYSIVDDAWASTIAGKLEARAFCRLAEEFANETAVQVWQILLTGLSWCDRFVHGATRQHYRSFVRDLVGPVLTRLGWQAKPGESDLDGELRGQVIRTMGLLGNHLDTQAECRRLHALADTDSAVDPTVAAAALAVVAGTGDADEYDQILAVYRTTENPQEKMRYLQALATVPHPEQIGRTFALCFSDEVKTQNAPFIIARMIAQRDYGMMAWKELRQRWKEATERFPDNTIARMVETVKTLSLPEEQADVTAFFSEHDIPQAAKTLQQILDRQAINVALRHRATESLAHTFG